MVSYHINAGQAISVMKNNSTVDLVGKKVRADEKVGYAFNHYARNHALRDDRPPVRIYSMPEAF